MFLLNQHNVYPPKILNFYLQYKMFLLNASSPDAALLPTTFTIQNVPIKYSIGQSKYRLVNVFTIQNVPIK